MVDTPDYFTSLPMPAEPLAGPARWYLFQRNRLLVVGDETEFVPPFAVDPAESGLPHTPPQYVGRLGAEHCLAASVDDDVEAPPGHRFMSLRRLFDHMRPDLFHVAVRAVQIAAWDRDNQFCGRCGEPTEQKLSERAKVCPRCGLVRYPRISPAIIVAVTDGPRLLLARAHRHPTGFFSVLAGFVEPGETLEEAVRREVREEVGLEVTDIHYVSSQPWPFPDSLMLAFTAHYAGGEIVLEEAEIAEAGWYLPEEIPATIPPSISVARRLIDAFRRAGNGDLAP